MKKKASNNKKPQQQQHSNECTCRKCIYSDLDRMVADGYMIIDKKDRVWGTSIEGLAAYRKANPQDFILEP